MEMKNRILYIMAFLYIGAGIMHFLRTDTFLKIMPPFLPFPLQLVYISGVCEIVFGTMLFFQVVRPVAAWLIILLLIAVFPANIYMAIDFYHTHNPFLWVALLRLPLQFLLIWWAWVYTAK
ncbi:DoxX family membrane protein [Dyadobacter flavalbus]|uniref:DoxX family membrane protein n=2 Tax=Dyadobacter flavalbus TaxID=2579942 RepID=A0A5M8QD27_9BACT|nr:DoxX family membrane protein [Dyadobacter flavalbus]